MTWTEILLKPQQMASIGKIGKNLELGGIRLWETDVKERNVIHN